MSSAIKYQLEYWNSDLHEGDILCTNSPSVGGTHLPDITVISPVFYENKIQFVVAARAHHSEIGGSSPGSSSSYAREIYEEGVNIETWKIVQKGKLDYEGLDYHFNVAPRKYGVSGTRNIDDNISDLKAQIAANQRGINLLKELFNEYGSETVLFYMRNVKKTAEMGVRKFLMKFARENADRLPLRAVDFLDDGTQVQVKIDINPQDGSAVFDFTGTSLESYSNLNAPKSVTASAVIYVLRCLVNLDIPLNQGCLDPCTLVIPENSLINPSKYAAVCAGNGMTSQRGRVRRILGDADQHDEYEDHRPGDSGAAVPLCSAAVLHSEEQWRSRKMERGRRSDQRDPVLVACARVAGDPAAGFCSVGHLRGRKREAGRELSRAQ
ncbi:hypothetical protein KL905_005424 [Ogataea polymorpha]|nr:hypothetical protein KL905_005424 [Ogataea polymorpha]